MLLIWMTPVLVDPAGACTYSPGWGEPIGFDAAEVQPPGFSVRFGNEMLSAPVYLGTPFEIDGEVYYDEVKLVHADPWVVVAPQDLPEGSYQLRIGDARHDIEVGLIETDQPAEDVHTSAVGWQTRRVAESRTSECRETQFREHLFTTVEVHLPSADRSGWAVEVVEREAGTVGWLALEDAPSIQTITADLGRTKGRMYDAVCVEMVLWSPENEPISEGQSVCSEPVGCSAVGAATGRPVLVGLLGLVGLLCRRRAHSM